MNLWIWQILELYLATAPANVHPVILLDTYCCHIMGNIVCTIEALGCQVEHIPPGCTPLCQPIDIGVCKPLKDCMTEKCLEYLYHQYKRGIQKITAPVCLDLAKWIKDALNNVSKETHCNLWRYGTLAYFD